MHHKLARAITLGGIAALGLGSAQAALAEPAQGTTVPCFTPALYYALGNATDGEVITLAPGCTYWLNEALPDINTNLTIIGDGATLRRNENTSGFTILSVTSNVTVSISSLSFDNGGGVVSGPPPAPPVPGVSRARAHSVKMNSVFDGMVSEGGAILNDGGGSLSISGGVFRNNTVDEYGGAIYNEDGSLSVTSATFIDNSAGYGGAIENESGATATITGGKFIGNSAIYYDDADAEGGAVYNDGTIHINLSTFSQNTSADGGGAFYNDGDGTATLVYDGISGNGAYQGGGIYNWYGSLTVNLSSITGNTAQDSGGGIYNYDGTVNAYGNYIHDNQPNNCTPDFFGCVN